VFISRSDRSPPPRRPRSFSGWTWGNGGWPRPGRPEVPTGRRTRNSDCTIRRLETGHKDSTGWCAKCRWIPRPFHALQPTGIGPRSILWCLFGWVGVERWPEHMAAGGRTGHNGREFHVTRPGINPRCFPTLTQKDWTGGMEPPGPYLDAQFLSYWLVLLLQSSHIYLCFQFPPGTFISIILAPQPINQPCRSSSRP